jgi:hypothetical protein
VAAHTDVAPTADGAYVYAAGSGAPIRYRRAASGWVRDTTWAPARYPIWGTTYAAAGKYVAVDGAGNMYLSHGMWVDGAPHTVIKYDSRGRFITRFGEWDNSWSLGTFYWGLGGISVTRDGSTVLTAEIGNNRVQSWERGATGAYQPRRSLGATAATDPDRDGNSCDYRGWTGVFAASYDVNLDAAGNVYVINTTCKQVLVFDPTMSRLIGNYDVRAGVDYPRPHGFAVGANGMVFVGENQRVVVPAGTASVSVPATRSGTVQASSASAAKPSPSASTVAPSSSSSGPGTGAKSPIADRRAPFAYVAFAPRRLVGPRSRRLLAMRVRCSERCVARITVTRRGTVVGRRVMRLSTRTSTLRTVLAARRSAGSIRVTVRVLDTVGNGRTYARHTYLRR